MKFTQIRRSPLLNRDETRGRYVPARMSGKGTAWIVFDAGGDLFKYRCYWFGGPCEDHLVESTGVATDVDAVSWAAARTPMVRIRLPDHRTYWAGTRPAPTGFFGTWRPGQADLDVSESDGVISGQISTPSTQRQPVAA